jgi:hypothetical protein
MQCLLAGQVFFFSCSICQQGRSVSRSALAESIVLLVQVNLPLSALHGSGLHLSGLEVSLKWSGSCLPQMTPVCV